MQLNRNTPLVSEPGMVAGERGFFVNDAAYVAVLHFLVWFVACVETYL